MKLCCDTSGSRNQITPNTATSEIAIPVEITETTRGRNSQTGSGTADLGHKGPTNDDTPSHKGPMNGWHQMRQA